MSKPVIAILTDFGLSEPYAGIMKGVILSTAPDAHIVDLTHEVPPQAVDQGAFLLETAWRWFPPGSIFLGVVDPGVGGSRRRIAIESQHMLFVGPDNGLLSAALPDAVRGARRTEEAYAARTVALDARLRAFSIENQSLYRAPVSATFEGRDVFAPVAAFLASGGAIERLGPGLEQVQAFPAFRAPLRDGKPRGVVVHVDTYGNVITDIRGSDIDPVAPFLLAEEEIPLVNTDGDADPEEIVALTGSSGFVEIALPGGSAAEELGVFIGDAVEQL